MKYFDCVFVVSSKRSCNSVSACTGLSCYSATFYIDEDIELAFGSCSNQWLLNCVNMLRVSEITVYFLSVDNNASLSASKINSCNRGFSSSCTQ